MSRNGVSAVVINDMVVARRNGDIDSMHFEIQGPALTQNGWKVRTRAVGNPFVYDPMASRKGRLREAIRRSLSGPDQDAFLFQAGVRLKVRVVYHLTPAELFRKDVDNMSKFLFDAMQKAIYANDSSIFQADLEKVESPTPRTLVFVSRF